MILARRDRLLHKLHVNGFGDDAGLVRLVQQSPDGFAATFAVVERPVIHVHADEFISERLIHVAGILQRVVESSRSVIERVTDALLEQPADLANRRVADVPALDGELSEDTLDFSARTGVRPRIEVFPLEQAEEAYERMMANRLRFRAVLVP